MTEIVWDGKKVKKLEIYRSGQDGECIWLRAYFEDGKSEDSYVFKGST